MTPEIIARVDACLAAHGITPGTDTRARRLARAWVTLRDLWTQDDATEAAATGVLLGLVPEVWGPCDVEIDPVAEPDGSPVFQVLVARDSATNYLCYPYAPTLTEAIVAALEAAP